MILINWGAEFRLLPQIRTQTIPGYWYLELKFLCLQISLYNPGMARELINLLNAKIKSELVELSGIIKS